MRCAATTASGQQCSRWLYNGADRCAQHETLETAMRRGGELTLSAVTELLARRGDDAGTAWTQLLSSELHRQLYLATHRDLCHAVEMAAALVTDAWTKLEPTGVVGAQQRAYAMSIALARLDADAEER